MIFMKSIAAPVLLSTFLLVQACGGGGSGGGVDSNDDSDGIVVEPQTGSDAASSDDEGDATAVAPQISSVDNFVFQFSPEFALSNTEEDRETITALLAPSVESINQIDNLFNNITVPVIYQNCGFANAFYSPFERTITLCDELLFAAAGVFLNGNTDPSDDDLVNALASGFQMLVFTMYHEMGHTFDDLRDVSIGGNFESVADAIGVVLSVQTGQPIAPILGGLFFLQNTDGSFADVHNSGDDRAGDIICWTLGGSPQLAASFPELTIALIQGGRDCASEYQDQFEFVSDLVPGLSDIPVVSALSKSAQEPDYKTLDAILSKELGKNFSTSLR